MKVKICGIRRTDDAEYLNRYMPDFAGFVFAAGKRTVTSEQAARLTALLDPEIRKAGVFVNDDIEHIVECVSMCGLDIVQLHGDEKPGYVERLSSKLDERLPAQERPQLWKAIRVKDRQALEKALEYNVKAFLLDGFKKGKYGGTGTSFDWSLAAQAKRLGRVILAGGLNAHNIREAVKTARPYAVDTSSGVETDGFKDERKIREFISICRSIRKGSAGNGK